MWLRCKVAEGQFDGEYAVAGDTPDGAGFSLFVPEEYIQVEQPVGGSSVEGWVKIRVLETSGNQVLVKLPRRTIENGTTMTVRSDDLETAPICQDA